MPTELCYFAYCEIVSGGTVDVQSLDFGALFRIIADGYGNADVNVDVVYDRDNASSVIFAVRCGDGKTDLPMFLSFLSDFQAMAFQGYGLLIRGVVSIDDVNFTGNFAESRVIMNARDFLTENQGMPPVIVLDGQTSNELEVSYGNFPIPAVNRGYAVAGVAAERLDCVNYIYQLRDSAGQMGMTVDAFIDEIIEGHTDMADPAVRRACEWVRRQITNAPPYPD